jgi:hypothetical protein
MMPSANPRVTAIDAKEAADREEHSHEECQSLGTDNGLGNKPNSPDSKENRGEQVMKKPGPMPSR